MVKKLGRRGALLVFTLCAPAWLLAAPADEVKALMESDRAADAYALGKRTPDALGDPTFDFFFGIAAIDTGHAGEGVLALERYLLSFPDNVSARQQLARGYYLMGDDARAREEFEALRKLNPPADVVTAIDRFLDSIRLREDRYSLSTGAYVEFGIGHDTNVNAAPSSVNGLQGVSAGSLKTPADFASLGAGGYINYPIKPGIALFAQGQGERKFNDNGDAKQFDLGNYNAAGGVSVLRDKNLYRFSVNYGVVTLGSNTYRDATGASAEWQHQFDDMQAITLGAQGAQFRYSTTETRVNGTVTPMDNSNRDADFYGVNAAYKRLFSHRWEPILTLGVNAGDQRRVTADPLNSALTPRTLGVNATLTFTPVPKWGVLFGYTYQQSDYKGPDSSLAFLDTRHDKYDAVNAAVSYLYSRNISFRVEALFSKNRSNSEVYAFTRDVYAAKVRYEFK